LQTGNGISIIKANLVFTVFRFLSAKAFGSLLKRSKADAQSLQAVRRRSLLSSAKTRSEEVTLRVPIVSRATLGELFARYQRGNSNWPTTNNADVKKDTMGGHVCGKSSERAELESLERLLDKAVPDT
jgi:hypothetical protein